MKSVNKILIFYKAITYRNQIAYTFFWDTVVYTQCEPIYKNKVTKWLNFRCFHNFGFFVNGSYENLSLTLLLDYLVKLLELEGEEKRTAFLVFRNKVDVSLELLNNKLTNNETKSDSLNIDLFSLILDWPKHLKKAVLMSLFNTNSWVNDWNSEELALPLSDDQNLASLVCKL